MGYENAFSILRDYLWPRRLKKELNKLDGVEIVARNGDRVSFTWIYDPNRPPNMKATAMRKDGRELVWITIRPAWKCLDCPNCGDECPQNIKTL